MHSFKNYKTFRFIKRANVRPLAPFRQTKLEFNQSSIYWS
jgi:hypothetical protein